MVSVARRLTLSTIYLHLTTRCNLRCAFCAIPNRNAALQELNAREVESLVDEAKGLGTTYIVLIGGEPFVREDIGEIGSYIVSRGIRLGVSTNGTLLARGALAWTDDLPRSMFFFGISLDGACAATHDALRGVPGSYERAMGGIRVARHLGIATVLQTVMQRANADEILAIAELAASFGAKYSVIPEIMPKGAGEKASSGNLSIREIIAKAREVHSVASRLGIEAGVNLPPALLSPERFGKASMPCHWAKHFCGIMPNGDVAMCHGCDSCQMVGGDLFTAGNVRLGSLSEIWRSSSVFGMLRALNPDSLEGVCGRCVIRIYCRGYCRVRAYLDCGSLLGPESLCQAAYEEGLFPRYMLER